MNANLRSVEQNARMWATLADISKQLQWPVDGELVYLSKEDWKDVITAGLRKYRCAKGIEGGFVMLGQRTSKMSVQTMTEVIDLAHAFGSQHGVTFTDPTPRSVAP